jgi:hypothetical protein
MIAKKLVADLQVRDAELAAVADVRKDRIAAATDLGQFTGAELANMDPLKAAMRAAQPQVPPRLAQTRPTPVAPPPPPPPGVPAVHVPVMEQPAQTTATPALPGDKVLTQARWQDIVQRVSDVECWLAGVAREKKLLGSTDGDLYNIALGAQKHRAIIMEALHG